MHWACAKIIASLAIPDASLLEILLDKVCVIFCGFKFGMKVLFFVLIPSGLILKSAIELFSHGVSA